MIIININILSVGKLSKCKTLNISFHICKYGIWVTEKIIFNQAWPDHMMKKGDIFEPVTILEDCEDDIHSGRDRANTNEY